jgi:hypothetical protein
MGRLGRCQWRVRRLLLVPAIVAFSCWLAIGAVDRQQFRELASEHEIKEAACEAMARAPIQEYEESWAMDIHRHCTHIKRALTEAELKDQRRARQWAAGRAAYHHSLKIKYTWASWLPWFPIAADPPPPD